MRNRPWPVLSVFVGGIGPKGNRLDQLMGLSRRFFRKCLLVAYNDTTKCEKASICTT